MQHFCVFKELREQIVKLETTIKDLRSDNTTLRDLERDAKAAAAQQSARALEREAQLERERAVSKQWFELAETLRKDMFGIFSNWK